MVFFCIFLQRDTFVYLRAQTFPSNFHMKNFIYETDLVLSTTRTHVNLKAYVFILLEVQRIHIFIRKYDMTIQQENDDKQKKRSKYMYVTYIVQGKTCEDSIFHNFIFISFFTVNDCRTHRKECKDGFFTPHQYVTYSGYKIANIRFIFFRLNASQ